MSGDYTKPVGKSSRQPLATSAPPHTPRQFNSDECPWIKGWKKRCIARQGWLGGAHG